MKRKRKTRVQLSGEDGNIFSILVRAKRALRKDGYKAMAEEMSKRVHAEAKSYDEALSIIQEYVEGA